MGELGGSEPSSCARGVNAPAVSSIHRALVRNNLVALQPTRPRPATQRFERASPNELWQIDFTELVLADESPVSAMDILDDHARFCLAAAGGRGPHRPSRPGNASSGRWPATAFLHRF